MFEKPKESRVEAEYLDISYSFHFFLRVIHYSLLKFCSIVILKVRSRAHLHSVHLLKETVKFFFSEFSNENYSLTTFNVDFLASDERITQKYENNDPPFDMFNDHGNDLIGEMVPTHISTAPALFQFDTFSILFRKWKT